MALFLYFFIDVSVEKPEKKMTFREEFSWVRLRNVKNTLTSSVDVIASSKIAIASYKKIQMDVAPWWYMHGMGINGIRVGWGIEHLSVLIIISATPYKFLVHRSGKHGWSPSSFFYFASAYLLEWVSCKNLTFPLVESGNLLKYNFVYTDHHFLQGPHSCGPSSLRILTLLCPSWARR